MKFLTIKYIILYTIKPQCSNVCSSYVTTRDYVTVGESTKV